MWILANISYVTWFCWVCVYTYVHSTYLSNIWNMILKSVAKSMAECIYIISNMFCFHRELCLGICMVQLPIVLKYIRNCILCLCRSIQTHSKVYSNELRNENQMNTIVTFEMDNDFNIFVIGQSVYSSLKIEFSCFFILSILETFRGWHPRKRLITTVKHSVVGLFFHIYVISGIITHID